MYLWRDLSVGAGQHLVHPVFDVAGHTKRARDQQIDSSATLTGPISLSPQHGPHVPSPVSLTPTQGRVSPHVAHTLGWRRIRR